MERLTDKIKEEERTKIDDYFGTYYFVSEGRNGLPKAVNKLGKLEDFEEQLRMTLLEFFSKLGKAREYMVTVNGKRFYPATLIGGEIRDDGKFVYCVWVHDVDNKIPFHDYFEKLYTREEAEKKLEELNNENT